MQSERFHSDCHTWIDKAQLQFQPELPATRQWLREHALLTIVVLGSSSVEGAGHDRQDESYPAYIAESLGDLLPEHAIAVLNKGTGGQTAHEMWRRLEEDVIDEKPALLIWDAVLTDVLHDTGVDNLARVIKRGISQAKAAGSDIALMDLPWFPRQERYPHYDDYRHLLESLAERFNVPIIPRYNLMQAMAQSGQFAQADSDELDVLRLSEESTQCLAILTATAIEHASR